METWEAATKGVALDTDGHSRADVRVECLASLLLPLAVDGINHSPERVNVVPPALQILRIGWFTPWHKPKQTKPKQTEFVGERQQILGFG